MEQEGAKKAKRGVVPLVVLLIVLICGVVAGAGFLVWQKVQLSKTPEAAVQSFDPQELAQQEEEKAENPVDFAALRQQNPEIYAWLYVLDTNVNMPGLQSVTDDFYYLDHNDQGEYAPQGAAFTQMANATDFCDPVTVMYGHQAPEDAMITYKIIAAYQYDDRHILNSYDFSDPQVRADYYARLLDPASMLVNMREGVQLSADDRILQLSTCMDAVSRDNTRYLVTGVLVDVQETY